jgi:hypothetical protein
MVFDIHVLKRICYPLFTTFSLHLFQGTIKKNHQLEIRPGSVSRDKNGQPICNPLIVTVASLHSIKDNLQLEQAVAGHMITIRSNINYDQLGGIVVNLSGYIIGDVNFLPDVFSVMKVRIFHTISCELFITVFVCLAIFHKYLYDLECLVGQNITSATHI